jgi:ABC-type transport system substrate-binding protein
MLEWLFEIDVETGEFKPWLAKSWELAPGGKSWRMQLQEGVQYHHGYGEFTAKDVVHNHALWCDDNYPGRKDPRPAIGPDPAYPRVTMSERARRERVRVHRRTSHPRNGPVSVRTVHVRARVRPMFAHRPPE